MDITGHLLLGYAVSGEVSWYVTGLSVLPDILSGLAFQYKDAWKDPYAHPRMLLFYHLCHSPLMLLAAWFLPDPGFIVVASHIVSDMFTHDKPWSIFPGYSWGFNKKSYYILLLILGGVAWLRVM